MTMGKTYIETVIAHMAPLIDPIVAEKFYPEAVTVHIAAVASHVLPLELVCPVKTKWCSYFYSKGCRTSSHADC